MKNITHLFYCLLLASGICINSNAQTMYSLGGNIYIEGIGDASVTTAGVVVCLDSLRSKKVSYGGGHCNYNFDSVTSGIHRLQITSKSTFPLDTLINVDHSALCGTGDSTYNFTLKVGMNYQGRELVIPDDLNRIWKYSYSSYYGYGGTGSVHEGIHIWQTLSRDVDGNRTTLTFSDIRRDSVYRYSSGSLVSIKYQVDTVYFQIIITSDSIIFGCPEVSSPYNKIPRYCLSAPDTLLFVWAEQYPFSSSAIYCDSVGIRNYSRSRGGNSPEGTFINLIECLPGTSENVDQDPISYPSEFVLGENYPNPFNPSTQITFSIPKATYVTLKIYDLLGQEISTLVNERKQVGEYKVTWNAEGVPSGVYFYRLTAGEFTQTKKMVLMK